MLTTHKSCWLHHNSQSPESFTAVITMRSLGLSYFVFSSIILHGMIAAYIYWAKSAQPSPEVQLFATRVSLGMRAASQGNTAAQENSPSAVQPPPDKAVSQEKPREEQPQKKPPVPREKNTLARQSDDQKETPEKQENKSEPPRKPRTQTATLASENTLNQSTVGQKGIDGSYQMVDIKQETGLNSEVGAASSQASFDAIILQHLMKFKRYPVKIRHKRLTAEVDLYFTLHRNGSAADYRVKRHGAHHIFSQAAILQLQRAQPFPEAPNNSNWISRDYRVKIRYSVEDT